MTLEEFTFLIKSTPVLAEDVKQKYLAAAPDYDDALRDTMAGVLREEEEKLFAMAATMQQQKQEEAAHMLPDAEKKAAEEDAAELTQLAEAIQKM